MSEHVGSSAATAGEATCARCHAIKPTTEMGRLKDGRWLCRECVVTLRAARAREGEAEAGSLAAQAKRRGARPPQTPAPATRATPAPAQATPAPASVEEEDEPAAAGHYAPELETRPCPKCKTDLVFGVPMCETCGIILDDFWEEDIVLHPLTLQQKLLRYGGRGALLAVIGIAAWIAWPREGPQTFWESTFGERFAGAGESLTEEALGVSIHPKITRVGRNFIIKNEDDFDWGNVQIVLNAKRGRRGFILEQQRLRGGVTYEFPLINFRQKDETAFTPVGVPITQIDIRADTGEGVTIWSTPFIDAEEAATVD